MAEETLTEAADPIAELNALHKEHLYRERSWAVRELAHYANAYSEAKKWLDYLDELLLEHEQADAS